MRLFLYGTLQPDAATPMAAWMGARLALAEPAYAAGRLHGIAHDGGWFPALVRGQGRVSGRLCDLALSAGDQARLDRYEGREYRRETVRVRTAAGRLVAAQAYLWRGAPPRGALRIPCGDFLDWLRRHRLPVFSQTACLRA
ncbi:gamma-glutamylcyclotransferase [Novosphingobium panipatense]|uniref:gamma-glutamylcyclotransferase family protein n=1 Tax=Novosphingobium TaxID=165696 RepID=UPI001E283BED|nr:gamma-glutamylcyclotransferase family protein [Novosphingobium sp. HII-3]